MLHGLPKHSHSYISEIFLVEKIRHISRRLINKDYITLISQLMLMHIEHFTTIPIILNFSTVKIRRE